MTPLDERERQQHADYEWCLRDAEVQRRYGGQVVAAQGFKVWGAGANHNEAWEAARAAGCPDLEALELVPIAGPSPASWGPGGTSGGVNAMANNTQPTNNAVGTVPTAGERPGSFLDE